MKKVLLFVLAALVMVACNKKPVGELTGATLSRTTLDLVEGATFRLVVKPTPDDAEFKATWSSSDEMVASVSSNGTVSANSIGTATISAAIEGTDIVATCQVTVKSILDATVFDQVFMWKVDNDAPYDVKLTLQDGRDSVFRAITALFAMFPSTMYVDGEGAMAGDGGYVLFLQTAFTINEANKNWYCLGDYTIVDNAINAEGKFRPMRFQAAEFNAENYAAYFTQYILYINDRAEQPNRAEFPYYRDNDAFFYRAFADEDGIGLMDGGYLTMKEDALGFISLDLHESDDRALAPKAYNLDAKMFSNVNNLGFVIEEQETEDGETAYVFVDKDGDNIFDMAEIFDYNFSNGSLTEAPAVDNFNNVRAMPEKAGMKHVAVNRALHTAMLMNIRVK